MVGNEMNFFTLLSSQIKAKIKINTAGTVEAIDFDKLKRTFNQNRTQLLETFGKQYSNDDERQELSACLIWLLNKLFWVAHHDLERHQAYSTHEENIALQNIIFTESFLKQRWFFVELIEIYIKVLQQVIDCNGIAKRVNISLKPSDEILENCSTNLEYQEVILENESAVENIIQMCLEVCTRSVQLYCNVYSGKGNAVRTAAIEILQRFPLSIKTSALVFLTEYFEHRSSFSDDDTQFFISIMQTMSIIFKDLPNWTKDETDLKSFKESSLNFFQKVPTERMNFSQDVLHSLMVCVTEVMLFQVGNPESQFAVETIADMTMKVLDDVDYAPKSVESLRHLVQCIDPFTPKLMKFVVIGELEQASDFSKNVTQTSSTWKEIHDAILLKTKDLSSSTNSNFTFNLGCISDTFFLALQIEFGFAHRLQIRHGLNPRTSSINFSESPFNQISTNMNYRHISLTMFDNLEEFTQTLVREIAAMTSVDGDNVRCIIDIFSCILKFSANTAMTETLKQLLIAVIAYPLCISWQGSQKFKQTAVQKIMTLLPTNIKTFYEKRTTEEIMRKLQNDCLAILSQLEISKMDKSCWMLIETILLCIPTQTNKSLTVTLCSNLTNFCVNNSDKFAFLIEIYQKLLQDKSVESDALKPLSDILCLTGGNLVAIKLLTNEHTSSFFIVCNVCETTLTDWSRESDSDEQLRHLAYLKETKGLLISTNKFSNRNLSLEIDAVKIFPWASIVHSIPNIPAMLNHSKDIRLWIAGDGGKDFFSKIFVKKEGVLMILKDNLKDIIRNFREVHFGKDLSNILNNCLIQIAEIVKWTAYDKEEELQSITISLVFTFATNVIDENVMVKCLKMLTYYIVQSNSKVIGEASLLALELAKRYGAPLIQLFNWHKTFIMRHVFNLMMTNLFSHKWPLLDSMVNFLKRLNFPRLHDFLPTTIDIIIALALPFGVKTRKMMTSLEDLCRGAGLSLEEAIEANFISIFQEIYLSHFEKSPEVYASCMEVIVNKTGKTIKQMLTVKTKKTIEEALVSYNKAPNFVMEVMSQILGEGPDITERAANDIAERFLGVLIFFEAKLTSNECERATKKNILLSLGGIIRLLSADRVSNYCFKIIAVLKVAEEQTSIDLSATCIDVWKILIRICKVTSLGPILSTIFVSLEVFTERYPREVNEILSYLVKENSSLLGFYMTDLFFIEKTQVDDEIKAIVTQQIDSQKMKEKSTYKTSLQSLIRHMTSENSDLKVRIYCLKYLKELMMNNRQNLNELICSQMTMDPIVEELLLILISNCKNTSSAEFQVALAECIGELGAIEPSLQQQNYASLKKFPKTIHSDDFAIMALTELCRSYRYKNNSKYIDALALGIQTVLRSRKVTVANKDCSEVWLAIPEKMRPLMETLLSSSYGPTKSNVSDQHPIFWTDAKNVSDWALKWSAKLINEIKNEATQKFLEGIRPSMKQNHHITSMFLPYIILHTLEEDEKKCAKVMIADEIQSIFDIVLGKSNNKEKSQVGRKPLYIKCFDFDPKKISKPSPENVIKSTGIKAAKLVFDIFDFLDNYIRTHELTSSRYVRSLMKCFSLEEMAVVSYECGEYARAMVYLETRMKEVKDTEEFQDKLAFLTNIYAKLGDSDAVGGIQKLKKSEWSLTERVLINSTIGNYQDSAVCCERMMQVGEAKIDHIHMMINSYLSLDQPATALLVYESMMQKFNETHQNHLSDEIKAEPLWRLGRFDELKELVSDPVVQESTSWGVKCGQLLLKFRRDDDEKLSSELRNTRLALMKNLKISGNERAAYDKSYSEVINLHLVSELEKAGKAIIDIEGKRSKDPSIVIERMIDDWNKRMEIVQKKAAIEERIYCFHRILLNETKVKLQNVLKDDQKFKVNNLIDSEVGKLWIKSAQLASKNMMYQQAQTYILNAENYQPKDLFIEKAELHWIKKDHNNAFKTLEVGTKNLLNGREVEELELEEKRIYSKGKLMIAAYNAEAVNVDFKTNKRLFAVAEIPETKTEKFYLTLAEYVDRHYSSPEVSEDESKRKVKSMCEVMDGYYKSMLYGSEHVFQSMPRFLSIWFDTTAKFHDLHDHRADIKRMNDLVQAVVEKINIFFFYTAFSQLISRICHQSPDVFAVLKTILVKLVTAFPQQSLWFLIPMLKSSHNPRVRRCKEILQDKRLRNSSTNLLVQEFNLVVDKFIILAEKKAQRASPINLEKFFPGLMTTLQSTKSKIMMPFQCNLQLTRIAQAGAFKFADTVVYILRVEDRVEVMGSLQQPKKVTLIGTDGKKYVVLIKHQDDLRIDLRFMEFSNVLKEFLHKDPESRQRQLAPRTYSVTPLNEDTGIIEWVPNLQTYKSIISNQYAKKNHKVPTISELGKIGIELKEKKKQVEIYRELIKKFYPALGDYYRQQFATPQAFYNARSAFIRTTAVMSIIGYILGLGDRHGENILIDVLSGETLHVDCNMLFCRGEQLKVPETVPFRLTHNMTDAMGILGIEGPFKKNCEIILRVLRKERKTLMSYLRPLIYNPSLKENSLADAKNDKSERIERSAIEHIEQIEKRLKGIVSKYEGSSGIELSTEGQVNFIIEEATNEEKLAAMFQGWLPWM